MSGDVAVVTLLPFAFCDAGGPGAAAPGWSVDAMRPRIPLGIRAIHASFTDRRYK
jgi:hypothetical protein